MSKITAVILLVLLAVGCRGTGQVLYPFPIESLLECHVQNPFARLVGQSPSVVELPPRLSLSIDETTGLWTPTVSG